MDAWHDDMGKIVMIRFTKGLHIATYELLVEEFIDLIEEGSKYTTLHSQGDIRLQGNGQSHDIRHMHKHATTSQ